MTEKEQKQRTAQQNRAMHLYFRLLAERLNEAGLEMKKVLKPTIDIWWTDKNVKEYLWRPIQKALLVKKSTTELDTSEVSKVHDVLNRHLSEKFGEGVDFPSWEELVYQSDEENKFIKDNK